jgi:hypothetical protein
LKDCVAARGESGSATAFRRGVGKGEGERVGEERLLRLAK